MTDKTAIRDAATLIMTRETSGGTSVLMGQRGSGAAFMPNKFVFPGGALDADDRAVQGVVGLNPECSARLETMAEDGVAQPLALAAIRETFEETGLILGRPSTEPLASTIEAPEGWRAFYDAGMTPATDMLRFIFRAITPPGRPRRFDARFFLADANAITGDPDDFSGASGELSHLTWIPLSEARGLEMPFITEIVLSEVEELLRAEDIRPVPFFHHDNDRSYFTAL